MLSTDDPHKDAAAEAAPVKRRRAAAADKPRRRTQAERSELMRHRLIAAASVILRKKGYVNLRTDEVARVAKVSRGALHHHFPSKDELVLALASYLLQRSLLRSTKRASTARTDADLIEAMVADAYAFFMVPEFAILIDLVVASVKNPSLRQHIEDLTRDARMDAESMWIDTLCARGVARRDASKIVWLTFNMVRGFSVRAVWQNDERVFRSMIEQWKSMTHVYIKNLGVEQL